LSPWLSLAKPSEDLMKSKSPLSDQVSFNSLFIFSKPFLDRNEPIQRSSKSTLEIDNDRASLSASNLRVIEHDANVVKDEQRINSNLNQ